MLTKRFLFASAILFSGIVNGFSQNNDAFRKLLHDEVVYLTLSEKRLFDLINEYRMQQKLPPLELSVSLSKTAQVHVRDLAINKPYNKRCNLHSWSDKHFWKGFCYTDNHNNAASMWEMPSLLTGFKGNGYEIAYWNNFDYHDPEQIAVDALNAWKNSQGHHNVIINRSIWKKLEWKAIGVGVYKGYVSVWFSDTDDGHTSIQQYNNGSLE